MNGALGRSAVGLYLKIQCITFDEKGCETLAGEIVLPLGREPSTQMTIAEALAIAIGKVRID
jgi:hypothetical protein